MVTIVFAACFALFFFVGGVKIVHLPTVCNGVITSYINDSLIVNYKVLLLLSVAFRCPKFHLQVVWVLATSLL